MRATKQLHDLGQSLWVENSTRDLLTSGTLKRYRDELSVTGLTSNPTIFDQAITHSSAYDKEIRRLLKLGHSGESVFFEIAVEDLTQAAEIFAPICERTAGVDGWASLEVSPQLAYDAESTVAEPKCIHRKARLPNLFIKIPGAREGSADIEEAIFSGVPVNVFAKAGVDLSKLAADLQEEGAKSFDASWLDLIDSIEKRCKRLKAA